jgi:hypothetical protein
MIGTLTAISTLRKYITQSDGMDSCQRLLDKIESDIHNFRIKNLKQKKITDYLLSDRFHVILINKRVHFIRFYKYFLSCDDSKPG